MRHALRCLIVLLCLCFGAPALAAEDDGAVDATADATAPEKPAPRPPSRFQGLAPSGVGKAPPGAQFDRPGQHDLPP
jgi:hypothetical protein